MPKEYQVTIPQSNEKAVFSLREKAMEMVLNHNPQAFITLKHTR